jgi:beta-lactamase regulating signal transducer with metallopeptidase domain
MPRLDPVLERWLVVAGWSAIVILWHTTIAALALATWQMMRRHATAPAQYRAALLALVGCVVLAVMTPLVLTSTRVDPRRAESSLAATTVAEIPRTTMVPPPVVLAVYGPPVRSVVSWLGLLWLVASPVALVRLVGGWALALWIRRRATAIPPEAIGTGIDELSLSSGLPPPSLFASAHVDAPVVLGHRAPAILLPFDAAQHLDAEAIAPLIAHELAHVARSDYAANLVQSIAEALLVFSPGVHWIARRIREAREYCCDDLVVARCGSRPYVEALTTLAGMGTPAHARPALSVAGPRLVVRIRRLLQEDSMIPFAASRLAGLVGALTLVAAAGYGLVPLSASALAQAPALSPAAVPRAFPPEQDGSSESLRTFDSTAGGVCGTARIQNRADIALVGVRFAAVLSASAESSPLLVHFSEEIPVDVAPGAADTVHVNLLTASDMPTRPVTGHVQASCMLAQARFANGHVWGIEPVTAQAIDIRMRFPKADVPRALVDAAPTSGNTNFCLDDERRIFSLGAIVGVRYEPGRFAKCVDGRWDGR